MGCREKLYRLKAVAVSGNGPTLVPLKGGQSLAAPLFWSQRIPEIPPQSGPGAKGRSLFLPRLKGALAAFPEIWGEADAFLGSYEYLSFLLGAEPAGVIPREAFAPFLWEETDQEEVGLPLPPLMTMAQEIGRVSPQAAEGWGLPAGIPIAAAGADYQMALLGTATIEKGRICDRAGTSEGVNYCLSEESTLSSGMVSKERLPSGRILPHPLPGLLTAAGLLYSTGQIFDWYRNITGQKRDSYEETLRRIAAASESRGKLRFYPRGCESQEQEFSGGAFLGLEPHHGPGDLGRAVVEALGFSLKHFLDQWEGEGLRVGSLRVSGGQGHSPLWNQMKADIIGRPVQVPAVADAEMLGTAQCAMAALGFYDDPAAASAATVKLSRTFEPDPRRSQLYREESAVYYEQQYR